MSLSLTFVVEIEAVIEVRHGVLIVPLAECNQVLMRHLVEAIFANRHAGCALAFQEVRAVLNRHAL
jgi:hypothetical protein